jgi:hypothetical protein
MDSQALEEAITLAQEAVSKQGDTVRSLKASAKDGKAEKVGVGAAQLLVCVRASTHAHKTHQRPPTSAIPPLFAGRRRRGHPEAAGAQDCARREAEGA